MRCRHCGASLPCSTLSKYSTSHLLPTNSGTRWCTCGTEGRQGTRSWSAGQTGAAPNDRQRVPGAAPRQSCPPWHIPARTQSDSTRCRQRGFPPQSLSTHPIAPTPAHLLRHNVQHTLEAGGAAPARLLRNHGHGGTLVQQAQLAVGVLLVAGVTVDAACGRGGWGGGRCRRGSEAVEQQSSGGARSHGVGAGLTPPTVYVAAPAQGMRPPPPHRRAGCGGSLPPGSRCSGPSRACRPTSPAPSGCRCTPSAPRSTAGSCPR